MSIVISSDASGNVTVTENGVERALFPNEKLVCDVTDVQINGTSILDDDVANIPIASQSKLGVVKVGSGIGIVVTQAGEMCLDMATKNQVKAGTERYKALVPNSQDSAVFYGLAKASGDTTQSASENEVGAYTEQAKASIREMLGVAGCVVLDGTTLADVYDQLSCAELNKTFTLFGSGTAMGLLTGDYITYTAKGLVTKVSEESGGVYDFIVLYATSGIKSFRLTGMTAEQAGTLSAKRSYTNTEDT